MPDEGRRRQRRGCLRAARSAKRSKRGQVLASLVRSRRTRSSSSRCVRATKEKGGRHTPFFANYRPQSLFPDDGRDGYEVVLPAGVEMVMPGDNIEDGGVADQPGGDGRGPALRDPRGRPHRRRRRRRQDHQSDVTARPRVPDAPSPATLLSGIQTSKVCGMALAL